jgi:SAM-dependent methyltransferase
VYEIGTDPGAKVECEFWDAEVTSNPDKLYAEIGTGPRHTVRPNCVYVEVNASVTADILIEPTYRLPFRNASLDGIGCLGVLQLDDPWQAVVKLEFARVLKPGGRIFVGTPFLQQALSSGNFIVDQLHTDVVALWKI